MLQGGVRVALTFAAGAVFAIAGFDRTEAAPSHGIAMHGQPKYGPEFAHLNYVNPDAPKGGSLRLGVLGSFDSLNPNIIKGAPASGVREYVYESLMARSYDEPFSLYGLLAETVETPEDRSWVKFRLRPQAHFSNGAPVTPDDVLFSWALLRDKGRPNYRSYYGKVTRAEKDGDNGVLFVFDGSGDREMPLIMGLMPILPQGSVAADGFDKTTLEAPVGSGPYTVSAISVGSSVGFTRDPDYWGRDLPVNRGLYNFSEIRFEYYRDATAMTEAFRRGLLDVQGDREQIDAAVWAGGYDFPAVRDGFVQKTEFDIQIPSGMAGLVFNTRRPLFSSIRVRQALSAVFDFEWMNKTLFHSLYARTESYFDRSELSSHGRAASETEIALLTPFSSALASGILDGSFGQPATDGSGTNRDGRRRAIALLDEAGYVLKDGVMTERATGAPFAFEMLCVNREQERIMLVYAQMLRQIGIVPQVRLADAAQYQRRLTSFDFDMVQFTWLASLSPGNEQTFRWSALSAKAEGSFNFAGVESAGADAAIAAMLAAHSRDEFVSAVRALDRVLLSGYYAIPLYHTPKQWVVNWSRVRHPDSDILYGARTETWWQDGKNEAAAP